MIQSDQIHSLDAENNVFWTFMGSFPWNVIPDSLKNADATYQGSIFVISQDILHNYLKNYVGHIIAKSTKVLNHINDLIKAFIRYK